MEDKSLPLALNTSQLLQRLGISRSSLYRLVKNGQLKPLKLFKRNKLFAYEDVIALLSKK